MKKKPFLYSILAALSSSLYSITSFAEANKLEDIVESFVSFSQQISVIESALAYTAGFGFAISALIKLKRYYTNPQEVQLSSLSIESLLAIALLCAPTIMNKVNETQHTFKSDVVYLKTNESTHEKTVPEDELSSNEIAQVQANEPSTEPDFPIEETNKALPESEDEDQTDILTLYDT